MTRSDCPTETTSTARRSRRLANIAQQRRTELRLEEEEAKASRPIRSSKRRTHKRSSGKPRKAQCSSTTKSQSGMTSHPPEQYSADTALFRHAPAPYPCVQGQEPQSDHFHSHHTPASTALTDLPVLPMNSTSRSDVVTATKDTAWTRTSLGSSAIQAAYISPYPGPTGESWEFLKVDFVGLSPAENRYDMQPNQTDDWWGTDTIQHGDPWIPIDPALCIYGPPVFQAPSIDSLRPTCGSMDAGPFGVNDCASGVQDLPAADMGLIDPHLEQHFSQQASTHDGTGTVPIKAKDRGEESLGSGRSKPDEYWLEVLREAGGRSNQTAFSAFEDGDGLLRVA